MKQRKGFVGILLFVVIVIFGAICFIYRLEIANLREMQLIQMENQKIEYAIIDAKLKILSDRYQKQCWKRCVKKLPEKLFH